MKFFASQRFNCLIGVDFKWASDWHWSWSMANGDRHIDLVGLRIVNRKHYPPSLMITLGPVLLGFLVDKIDKEEATEKRSKA